jgi:hypothetical protein
VTSHFTCIYHIIQRSTFTDENREAAAPYISHASALSYIFDPIKLATAFRMPFLIRPPSDS